MSVRFGLMSASCLALCGLPAPIRAQGAGGDARVAQLTGRVADGVGAAIAKAEILIANTTIRGETGPDGRFELTRVPAGAVEVLVRRLGFSPAKIPLDLTVGERRDIRVLLSPVAMLMDSISVTAEQPEVEVSYGGFETRRARGFGTFLTRDDIEKKRPRVPSDLFRTMSGVKLIRDNGTPTIVSNRLGVVTCPLRVFVDGANYPLYGQSLDALIQVGDIGAIEVYPGGATVPPQFGGRESTCGVVAIWTRHGEKKP